MLAVCASASLRVLVPCSLEGSSWLWLPRWCVWHPFFLQPPPLCCLSALAPFGDFHRLFSCPLALPSRYRLMSPFPTCKLFRYKVVRGVFAVIVVVVCLLVCTKSFHLKNSGAGCYSVFFANPLAKRDEHRLMGSSFARLDRGPAVQCLGVRAQGWAGEVTRTGLSMARRGLGCCCSPSAPVAVVTGGHGHRFCGTSRS